MSTQNERSVHGQVWKPVPNVEDLSVGERIDTGSGRRSFPFFERRNCKENREQLQGCSGCVASDAFHPRVPLDLPDETCETVAAFSDGDSATCALADVGKYFLIPNMIRL